MTTTRMLRIRRVGQRRTWPLGKRRSEYEIVVTEGSQEVYRTTTSSASAVLVTKCTVHTTDAWDWIKAADSAYNPHQDSWVSYQLEGTRSTQ